jgi:hypothetical protein
MHDRLRHWLRDRRKLQSADQLGERWRDRRSGVTYDRDAARAGRVRFGSYRQRDRTPPAPPDCPIATHGDVIVTRHKRMARQAGVRARIIHVPEADPTPDPPDDLAAVEVGDGLLAGQRVRKSHGSRGLAGYGLKYRSY